MSRPSEAPRDQVESAFTPILRRAWDALPSLLAVVFVDDEGECIDYVSALDPFDAKVSAAHGLVLMGGVRSSSRKLGLREPVLLSIIGSARELWVRRVSDDYLLVMVVVPGADITLVRSLLREAGREFRAEVGVAPPAWEETPSGMDVTVRSAVGWPYAPAHFTRSGSRVTVSDVLGRWTEDDTLGSELVCFRVRTDDGQELTLVHDLARDGWSART